MSLKVAGRLVFRSIHLPGTEQHVVLVAIALVDKRGDTLRAVLVQRLPELGTTRGKDPAHQQRNRAWAEPEVDPHRCAEVSPHHPVGLPRTGDWNNWCGLLTHRPLLRPSIS